MLDELCSASIAVAPMQSGSGMQIKVLEAMAVGLPMVATELGRGDIASTDTKNILIANEAHQFSIECIRLLSDEKLRANVGNSAREFIRENHSWDIIKEQYINVYGDDTK
jgi:glycosyltransferase involved in cell wall biosynthesis